MLIEKQMNLFKFCFSDNICGFEMADILKNLKTTIENCNPNEVPAWIHRYYRKLSLYSVHEAKTKTNGQVRVLIWLQLGQITIVL